MLPLPEYTRSELELIPARFKRGFTRSIHASSQSRITPPGLTEIAGLDIDGRVRRVGHCWTGLDWWLTLIRRRSAAWKLSNTLLVRLRLSRTLKRSGPIERLVIHCRLT